MKITIDTEAIDWDVTLQMTLVLAVLASPAVAYFGHPVVAFAMIFAAGFKFAK